MIRHLVFLFAAGTCLLGPCATTSVFPCPPEEQISPCICTVTYDGMGMDCSKVESAKQLKKIFHSNPPFPFTHFNKFKMDSNEAVKKLQNGVFNVITFDEIEIINGVLTEVEQGSLQESKEVLKTVTMSGNKIVRFLMDDAPDMTIFKQLEYLDLSGNKIHVFPDIKSTTLKELYLNDNPINILHNENLFGVRNLEVINISAIHLNILETRLLSNHKKLKHIYLNNNNLEQIQNTALIVQSPHLKYIYLSYNKINDVEPGAFDMNVRGLHLNFEGNLLTTLDELTWKPLINAGITLNFNDNPLQCRCDIMWAVVPPEGDNTDYLQSMEGQCPEGQDIIDLDPEWYIKFC